jgi:hypothetical protein
MMLRSRTYSDDLLPPSRTLTGQTNRLTTLPRRAAPNPLRARRSILVYTTRATPILMLLALPLAGCATTRTAAPEPVTRNLPGPPSYLQPAEVPPARVGSSPFVVSEQRKQVIVRQNKVITSARDAWSKMKATYQRSFLKRKMFGG